MGSGLVWSGVMTERWRAVLDLCKRYRQVWSSAWVARHQLDAPPRLPHETQFLPAALALQDTPVSPLPRVTAALIILFAALTLLWAVFGRIDVVATAQGKIVPDDRSKTIQAFEIASVKAIYVRDGQRVKAGEILIELDGTHAQAEQTQFQQEAQLAQLQIARARALLAVMEKAVTQMSDTELSVMTASVKPKSATQGLSTQTLSATQTLNPVLQFDTPSDERLIDEPLKQQAQRLMLGQFAEYQAKRVRIEAEIAKRQGELKSVTASVQKLEQTLPLAQRRAADFKGLLAEHYVAEHEYLDKEQIRIEHQADVTSGRATLTQLAASLREAQGQLTELETSMRRTQLDLLQEGLQKHAALTQEIKKAQQRTRLMTLTAPVDGMVQQLAVHTLGGVVTPAEALMVIVPQDNPLEIEAFIENKDIGFVQPGQAAEVKIETFQFTKYGLIPAQILSVSHDAINDEKRGLIYSTRVKLLKDTLLVNGQPVRLGAGMAVSVEIKTGHRRVIEYFLSPLLQHGHESLRER